MSFNNKQIAQHQFQDIFSFVQNPIDANFNSCFSSNLPFNDNQAPDSLVLGPRKSNHDLFFPPIKDNIASSGSFNNNSSNIISTSSPDSSDFSSPGNSPLPTNEIFNCQQTSIQQLPSMQPYPPPPLPPPIPSPRQLSKLYHPQDDITSSLIPPPIIDSTNSTTSENSARQSDRSSGDENSESSNGESGSDNNRSVRVRNGNSISPFIKNSKPKRSSANKLSNTARVVPNSTLQMLLKDQNIKKRRLARKAELARESRKKKKMRIIELEQEVADLKAELEMVRKQGRHSSVKKEPQQETPYKDIVNTTKQIVSTYKKSSSQNCTQNKIEADPELEELVKQLLIQFKANCFSTKNRLEALKSVLVPGLPLQFLQWALSQSNKFYEDPSGLWQSIIKEINASQEQADNFLKLRESASRQRDTNMEIESSFAKLTSSLKAQLSHNELILRQISRILTPQQIGMLFHWIDQFGHICVKINL